MQNDKVQWWPIYHDDNECVGKVQLCIGTTIKSDETHNIKVCFLLSSLNNVVMEPLPVNCRFIGNLFIINFSWAYRVDLWSKLWLMIYCWKLPCGHNIFIPETCGCVDIGSGC